MRIPSVVTCVSMLLAGPACSSTTSPQTAGYSILFVGNSLTYTNDLPAMVERIAEIAGESVEASMVAGPNMAVVDHTPDGSEARTAIDQRRWSFVVLQQGPTPAGICRDTLVIAAMRLAPDIRAGGARPTLFAPWSRRTLPQSLGAATESATAAARAVGGIVLPVGDAWLTALSANPQLQLYSGDGYHPAPTGTLLAALTIYDRLLGQDVRELPAGALAGITGSLLPPGHIAALLTAAHQASTGMVADPDVAVPVDTTVLSPGGGPC
jgi:hypothetical protein